MGSDKLREHFRKETCRKLKQTAGNLLLSYEMIEEKFGVTEDELKRKKQKDLKRNLN